MNLFKYLKWTKRTIKITYPILRFLIKNGLLKFDIANKNKNSDYFLICHHIKCEDIKSIDKSGTIYPMTGASLIELIRMPSLNSYIYEGYIIVSNYKNKI